MRAILFLLSALFVVSSLKAQYVFEHMNGKLLKVLTYDDSAFVDIKFTYDKNSFKNDKIAAENENLRFDILEKKGDAFSIAELDSIVLAKSKALKPAKMKESFINAADVFAIHNPDGTKKILYYYNEGFGNYYSENDMQMFIFGERDALLNYKAKVAFWGGLGVGVVSGVAMQGSVFSALVPFAWTLGATIPVIRIKDRYMTDTSLKTEPYKSGFARTARTKNMIQGLKGSVIGVGLGVLIYSVLAANSPNIN